jgi:porin
MAGRRGGGRRGTRLFGAGVSACAALATAPGAQGAPPPLSVPVTSEQTSSGAPGGFDGFLAGLKKSNYLLGDLFGVRSALSRYGVSLAIQETSEVLGDATGGVHKGADYDGLTQAILQLNTQRAFGWYGGLFNVSALQVHGRNLSADNLATIQTASGIEADRSTRLWELWYDQKFLEEDRADIKVGLISADQEFIVSPNALYFVNTMFGWPALPSYDLPGGGPAYPLSAPAVRFRWRPLDPVTVMAGVFNGAPARRTDGDAQAINASGTQFPLNGGTLTFLELQYAYPALGAMVMPGAGAPLGRTYKLGAWYDSETFDDLRVDDHGVPLASPLSDGAPRRHRGQYAVYGVADQMLWRQANDPNRSVSAFTRVMGSPQADRSFLTFSANVGLTYHDPVANRPAKVSNVVSAADRDANAVAQALDPTAYGPVRHDETFIEATYQYQVRPWWQVQPDIQYVFDPGGGVADPNRPLSRVKNELVLGVRTNVLF